MLSKADEIGTFLVPTLGRQAQAVAIRIPQLDVVPKGALNQFSVNAGSNLKTLVLLDLLMHTTSGEAMTLSPSMLGIR